VEDVEGFNGAGLYTSYTGYLRPEAQADPDDRDNTIESAIQKAWASYWSFEAFEERRAEQIDHLSGAMGLVVHARFDDDLEREQRCRHLHVPAACSGRGDRRRRGARDQRPGRCQRRHQPRRHARRPEVIVVRRVDGAS
jgi:hypothetical protein